MGLPNGAYPSVLPSSYYKGIGCFFHREEMDLFFPGKWEGLAHLQKVSSLE
jgi:hypothetical protein